MKKLLTSLLLALLGATLAGPATAQTNLAGTWQGNLQLEPGKSLAIHFVITAKPGGGYTAIVTSPDDGAIKNEPASSVKFADDKLAIEVPALSGGYAGTLRNGVIEGEWSQAGAKLPLSLRPLVKAALTKADIDALRGEWSGRLSGGGGTVTIVLHVNTGTDGALRATFDVPEQGVMGWEAKDASLDAGRFSVNLPKAQARIVGALSDGQIAGNWQQMGMSVPLTLKKGKYVQPVFYLDLSADAREKLKGRWKGTLNGLAVVTRFETDAQGRMQAFFDSTQQNILNIQITEAALTGTKLTFSVSYGAKYSAELAADKLTGEWSQPGLTKPLPLVLTREK